MNDQLFTKSENRQTRWASFENPLGQKGQGGKENGKAKGHAFDVLEPGASHTLLNTEGSGIINRIWLTITQKLPEIMRAIKIEMFWDGADKPAVSAPLADFFCNPLGMPVKFESALFSNPEGRSYNSFVQMPFLKGARIVITNESDIRINHLFYDVDYTLMPMDESKILYFHGFWNRENPTKLTEDYIILPKIKGEGKFIGVNVGVKTNAGYETSWFGEGEMKFYLDGDDEYPTLCGTGTEDYIGTAWGQGTFANMTQGSLIADRQEGIFSFYRFHTIDPIYFYQDIKVQLQTIGGSEKYNLLKILNNKVPIKVISRDGAPDFNMLYEKEFTLTEKSDNGHYNYYREDDFSSTAYFYYDKPCSGLPGLMDVGLRR